MPSRKHTRSVRNRSNQLPPMDGSGRTVLQERRDVSLRYLAGTFLAGTIALSMMGGALWAAVDGAAGATARANISSENWNASIPLSKAGRLAPPRQESTSQGRDGATILSVPTLVASAEGTVVEPRPFAHVRLDLAIGYRSNRPTPRFDPLAVFEPAADTASLEYGAIYGAEVDTAVRIKRRFLSDEEAKRSGAMSAQSHTIGLSLVADHIGEVMTNMGESPGRDVQGTAALPYAPPAIPKRLSSGMLLGQSAPNVALTARNVSIAYMERPSKPTLTERVVPLTTSFRQSAQQAVSGETPSGEIERFANALAALDGMAGREPAIGTLKLTYADDGQGSSRLVRASLYDDQDFRAAVALDDEGDIRPASRDRAPSPVLQALEDTKQPQDLSRSLHDALHQAAFAQGIPDAALSRMIELIASRDDFRRQVTATDEIELLFALPQDAKALDGEAELVFMRATLNDETVRLYRHVDDDERVGWFDTDSGGAKPFLLRKPLAEGRFRSSFGMRRHPIRRRMKMHWGVDWAAPSGTPIMAAADGTVREARWAGGNGRRVILRHANGYETSYSHQRRFAKGIEPGVAVRQGQVIGYVGTTGLSTGNHLHYELSINGERVDPMRVRLPAARSVPAEETERFQETRDRIDELLDKQARRQAERPYQSGSRSSPVTSR